MDYIKLFTDRRDIVEELDDAEAGRVFKAILAYAAGAELPEMGKAEKIVFIDFRRQADQEQEAYEAKCGRNRANVRKRWDAVPDTTASDEIPHDTTVYDRIPKRTVVGKEKEKEKEKEKDKSLSNERDSVREEMFSRFWSAYPRHTAKQTALAAFKKLNPDEQLLQTILTAIERQKVSPQWTKDGGQFVPYPATWLNQRRWEDETPKAVSSTGRVMPAQQYSQRDYSGADDALPDWVIQKGREMGILGGESG